MNKFVDIYLHNKSLLVQPKQQQQKVGSLKQKIETDNKKSKASKKTITVPPLSH